MKEVTRHSNNKQHVAARVNIGDRKTTKPFMIAERIGNESDAMTLCRAKPMTFGIQTLNLMLDPTKALHREEKIKVAKAQYHKDFGQLDITKSYNHLYELLWYTKLPCFDVKGVTSQTKDEMSVIKRCYWKGFMIDCALIFVTRPTDRGMCCTFNQAQADKIFKIAMHGNMTSKLQHADRDRRFDDTSLPIWYALPTSYPPNNYSYF